MQLVEHSGCWTRSRTTATIRTIGLERFFSVSTQTDYKPATSDYIGKPPTTDIHEVEALYLYTLEGVVGVVGVV